MTIEIKKDVVSKLITRYYKEQYDMEGETSMSVSKELAGYPHESMSCVLRTKFKTKVIILGEEQTISIDINENQIMTIVKYYLEQEGHTVKDVSINKGINSAVSGYWMMEQNVYKPYFRGVEVKLEEKTKKIGGMKNEN